MASKKILVQEDFVHVSSGSNPAAGFLAFYPKSDNNFYLRTSAGVEKWFRIVVDHCDIFSCATQSGGSYNGTVINGVNATGSDNKGIKLIAGSNVTLNHAYEDNIVNVTINSTASGPTITASDTQVLFMSGSVIAGAPGFNYKQTTSDFSVGAWASATGGNSYAFGGSATADAFSSIALGYLSYAGGEGAIAIGGSAEIYANYSVGIGHGAMCDNKNSIAIGRGAYAMGEGDTVLGSSSYSANAYIYGAINFPSLSGTGFLKITNGLVSVDTSSGFVTSVGLSMPSIFSVTGSPVTGSGTLTANLVSQTKNTVFAAPQSSNGVPTFRKLTADDMPDLSAMYDNYYSWNMKVNSGSTYQILRTGSAVYTNAYNGINMIAGSGITLSESSVIGGALGITVDCNIASNESSTVTYASSTAVATGGAFTAISNRTLPTPGTYLVLVQIMFSFTSALNSVRAKIFNGSNTYASTHLASPLNDTTYKVTTFYAVIQTSTNNHVVYLSATAQASGASVISNTGIAVDGTVMSYIKLT